MAVRQTFASDVRRPPFSPFPVYQSIIYSTCLASIGLDEGCHLVGLHLDNNKILGNLAFETTTVNTSALMPAHLAMLEVATKKVQSACK